MMKMLSLVLQVRCGQIVTNWLIRVEVSRLAMNVKRTCILSVSQAYRRRILDC